MTHRKLLIATAMLASVVTTACSDTTAPKQPVAGGVTAAAVAPSLSTSSPRSGAVHLTKECSTYAGQAGDFCTIIASNVGQIPVGSRVFYLAAADLEQGTYDGDVELRVKPGNVAFGHVVVTDLFSTIANTNIGNASFSGRTGRFTGFHAQIVVSVDIDPLLADWNGTYSFSPRD
jgi:hypothetical protein